MSEIVETKGSVPKLRFPGFQGSPAPVVKLRSIATICSDSVALSSLVPNSYVSTESLLPDFGGFGLAAGLPTTSAVRAYKRGDILVSNIRPYLKKVWYADRDGGASNDVLVFRNKVNVYADYLAQIITSNAFILHLMKGAKGVKMPRGDADNALSFAVLLPEKVEQRKIAECLQSLDKLIAVETEKLEAVKRHKKGLLQQLFPAEGEITPRCRFPQFHGDWRLTTFEAIIHEVRSGKSKHEAPGASKLYGSTGVIGTTNNAPYSGEYILIARVGANAGYLTYIDSENFGATDNTLVLAVKSNACTRFSFFYLSNLDLNRMAFGSGQPLITGSQLKSLAISLPDVTEQRGIADIMTGIDFLLSETESSLLMLRSYKQGFMQQLFPSLDELDGPTA